MIEIRCCHALAEAAPYRGAMNALNLASARPDPFSTFEFYAHHLRYHAGAPGHEPARLWLLLAFEDGALVGYAALKRRCERVLGLRAAKLDWLTAHRADRPHLVARAERADAVAAALYGYLLRRRDEWSLLEFQQQEPAAPLLSPPAAASSGGHRYRQWPNQANGTIAVRWTSIAGYFAALTKKARSNVSRQMRSLLAAGDVQVLTSSDPASRAALFALYRAIEPHSWKRQAGAAIGDRPSLDYFDGLMDPAQPMQLVIQVLLLDGAPIAGLICGAFDRGLYALHIVHDGRRDALAPGSAILLMGVRLAIEGGYRFFNLLRGSGYYKERWLADMSETCSAQVYRITRPFFWHRLAGDLRRRWSGPAADHGPPLFNPARRGLDRGEAAAPADDAGVRARHAALVAEARRGRGEFLSAAQLAAVLPFATQRAAGQARVCAPASG